VNSHSYTSFNGLNVSNFSFIVYFKIPVSYNNLEYMNPGTIRVYRKSGSIREGRRNLICVAGATNNRWPILSMK